MKDPYAFAPESGEDGHGTVRLADDHGVHHEFSPVDARDLARQLTSAADAAETTTTEEG